MEHVVAGTKEFADKLRCERIDLDRLSETLAAKLIVEFSQPVLGDDTARKADDTRSYLAHCQRWRTPMSRALLCGVFQKTPLEHISKTSSLTQYGELGSRLKIDLT